MNFMTNSDLPTNNENRIEPKINLADMLRQPIFQDDSKDLPISIPTKDTSEWAVPPEVFDWLKGKKSAPPASISKMMTDISNKLSYYISYSIIQRSTGLSRLIQYLDKVEQKIFPDNENFEDLTMEQLISKRSMLDSSITSFLDLTRRFTAQSKDIGNDPDRSEIINMIKSLDSDSIEALKKSLFNLVTKKTGKTIDPSKMSSNND
jgi:hypothetical protein